MTRARQIVAAVVVALAAGVGIPAAYVQVAGSLGFTVDEVQEATRQSAVVAAYRLREIGASQDEVLDDMRTRLPGAPEDRLRAIVASVYSRQRDPLARRTHRLAVLATLAVVDEAQAAIAAALCAPLALPGDAGPQDLYARCLAREGSWLGERYCDGEGVEAHRGGRDWLTPSAYQALVAALDGLPVVLADPATDEAYSAARAAAGALPCPAEDLR